jgi:hypothetical protein
MQKEKLFILSVVLQRNPSLISSVLARVA